MPKLPRFYVGQKVVCIVNSPSLKKDKIYTVTTVRFDCKCGSLGVGIPPSSDLLHCHLCHKIFETGNDRLFPFHFFEPIIEDFQTITFEKVVENEKVCVN